MRVNCIIAGAQKCGTTALHSLLSNHPKVVTSQPKELDFFNFDINYYKGLDFYHSHFKLSLLKKVFGNYTLIEATPSYINNNPFVTAERIFSYNNSIIIIIMVRDPIDRAFSAWQMYRKRFFNGQTRWWIEWMQRRTGNTPDVLRRTVDEYNNFDLFVEREIAVLNSGEMLECPILQHGHYGKGIGIFRKVFNHNLHVFKMEDLLLNTSKYLSNISNILNIPEFNWSEYNNFRTFEGGYTDRPSNHSTSILQDYYSDSDSLLYNETGFSYFR